MDQIDRVDKKKLVRIALSKMTAIWCLVTPSAKATTIKPLQKTPQAWKTSLRKKLEAIEKSHSGQVGVYVRVAGTNDDVSLHADEHWYIASGVKIPIALAVFKRIDQGSLTLDTRIHLGEDDYVDGAGETNSHKPGSLLSVRYLLEQMLIQSDNTASDLLIRAAGLEEVNAVVKSLVPEGFMPITTLGEVRRQAYGCFHPKALALPNREFMAIKKIADEKGKIQKLSQAIDVPVGNFKCRNLNDAFGTYYSSKLNSATLRSYGALLESIIDKKLLSDSSTRELLSIMTRVETGKNRIKAGLPAGVTFAHKTGTQHARVCDFGVAWIEKGTSSQLPGHRVIIAACARDFTSTGSAERVLKDIGKAVAQSGILTMTDGD